MYDIVRYRVRIAYDIGRKNVRLFSLIVRFRYDFGTVSVRFRYDFGVRMCVRVCLVVVSFNMTHRCPLIASVTHTCTGGGGGVGAMTS